MRLSSVVSLAAPPSCLACGHHAREREPVCAACRRSLRWLGPEPVLLHGLLVWAPVAYEGAARPLARALKYRGAFPAAAVMAAQMAATARPARFAEGTALVPVPLTTSRRRRRGFNQAERLAAGLGVRTGLTVSDCLKRRGGGGAQVGRDREARLAALQDAIALRSRCAAPERVLLIDDVCTTGATLAACARALRAAGSRHVAAAVYALTPGR